MNNNNYVICPDCGLWYDKTKSHSCPNKMEDKNEILKSILFEIKKVKNLLEQIKDK
jgi:hypothetical protein